MLSAAAALAIGLLALSHQSLWIDELGTWRLTRADTLSAWLPQLLGWRNSDAQIPIYHAWIKLWVSLFGDDEWALRASNLPWLMTAGYAFWRAPVDRSLVPLVRWTGVICLLHPLTWYYLNEARPYLMMLAAAAFAGVGLIGCGWPGGDGVAAARPASVARHFLIVGAALLAVTSAVGAIWTLAFVPLALSTMWRRDGILLGMNASHGWAIAGAAVVTSLAGAQYVHSFLNGVTATTLHEHKLVNFAFAFYELLGLGGIGPGREELRVNAWQALRTHGAAVSMAAFLLVAMVLAGIRALWRRLPTFSAAMLLWAFVPVLVLFFLAEFKHWRVVGRHLLPLSFFVCLAFAAAIEQAWRASASVLARVMATLLLGVLLASSLSIRFADRHERERYREAASIAAQALLQGRVVWWFADAPGPEYYGLGAHVQKLVPIEDYEVAYRHLYDGMSSRIVTDCRDVRAGTLLILENPDARSLKDCPPASRVIYSRRDTFDTRGTGMAWMLERGMQRRWQFMGFEVWE